jgi:5'-phosphate synthase pdxT subunit
VTSAPRVGVLSLQGDVREHLVALEASGARTSMVRTREDLAEVDALVIPGGESTTMSKLALLFDLMLPLREAVAAGMPMYGSCAGLIMLADRIEDGRPDQETIGGIDITVRRNAFGRQVDSFEIPITIGAIGPQPFDGVFIRAPWVEQVGPGVQVLARIEQGPRAGTIVAVQHEGLLATSFHPEITGDHRVHQFFVESVRQRA